MRKILLLWLMGIFATSSALCQNGLIFNQLWMNGPDGTYTYKIATLQPNSNAASGDHLHLVATVNCNDFAACNSSLDAAFGNRGGFHYVYSARGANATNNGAKLLAYQNDDGSVDIYMKLESYYIVGGYTILENMQETVYSSPTAQGNWTPPGTLVFDSSDPDYAPSLYVDFVGDVFPAGKIGIGTSTPQASIQDASPSVNLATTYAPFGNGNLIVEGQGPRSMSTGAAVTFALAAALDGSDTWEQARIIATADNPNNGDANGRLFLQTRHVINGGWDWQNNLVLTSLGFVGVGTTNPTVPLEVAGSIKTSGLIFPDGSVQTTAVPSSMNSVNGSVGIGTTNTPAALNVLNTSTTNYGETLTLQHQGAGDVALGFQQIGVTSFGIINRAGGDLAFVPYYYEGNPGTEAMRITNGGSVGIGTTTPGSDLLALNPAPVAGTPIFEVKGDIALAQNSAGKMYFSDGSVQSVAWNGTTLGGDYAEAVDVLGDRAEYEAGDVIVIDDAVSGKFAKAEKAYSRMVAGVFSTKPGLVGRRTTADRPNKDAEVPMAMMGIAPTKVSTENGPIERGDLLVSANTPGYAMKGTDPGRLMGAVIGKALAPLKSGTGVIEVLISLQ